MSVPAASAHPAIMAPAPAPQSHGVIFAARTPSSSFGMVVASADRMSAFRNAEQRCNAGGPGCRVIAEFTAACGAVAQGIRRHQWALVMTNDASTWTITSTNCRLRRHPGSGRGRGDGRMPVPRSPEHLPDRGGVRRPELSRPHLLPAPGRFGPGAISRGPSRPRSPGRHGLPASPCAPHRDELAIGADQEKLERSIPMYFRPYMDFSTQVP